MVILSAMREYCQLNTLTSDLLYYKYIIYKSPNKPNQDILLTMSPYKNTRSGYTASNETLDIVPPTSPTSPYLSTYDLSNIHNFIKSMTEKHYFYMKALNHHISAMLAKLTDTSSKTDNQEEQLTEISFKLSKYE